MPPMACCAATGGVALGRWHVADPEGWQPDPFGLYGERYFSDGRPTRLVRDGTVESYDAPGDDRAPGAFFEEPPREGASGELASSTPVEATTGTPDDEPPEVRAGDAGRWWWSGPVGLGIAAACVLLAVLATTLVVTNDHTRTRSSPRLHHEKHKQSYSSSSSGSSSSSTSVIPSSTSTSLSQTYVPEGGSSPGGATFPVGSVSPPGNGNVAALCLGPVRPGGCTSTDDLREPRRHRGPDSRFRRTRGILHPPSTPTAETRPSSDSRTQRSLSFSPSRRRPIDRATGRPQRAAGRRSLSAPNIR